MEYLETDRPTALKAYDIYYLIGGNSVFVRGAFTSDVKACVFAHAVQPRGSHFEVWKGDELIYARPTQRDRVAIHHQLSRPANGLFPEDDHLLLGHIAHREGDAADAVTGLAAAGEGHPVGAEGGVVVDHNR